MGYIKTLPLPPPRCRSVPHQLPPASAVCIKGSIPCFFQIWANVRKERVTCVKCYTFNLVITLVWCYSFKVLKKVLGTHINLLNRSRSFSAQINYIK